MSTSSKLRAQPPVSPHANLSATSRAGTNKSEGAIWRVACTCGATFIAMAHAFRIGETKCSRCQPSLGDAQAMEILMLLPATFDALAKKLRVSVSTTKSRVRAMRKNDLCHTGKWKRSSGGGSFQPIIVAGPGEDVPCTLTTLTSADHKRKYRKRVRKAVEVAKAGGKEDPRYSRQISRHQAMETAKRTRTEPQNPFSALFVAAGAREVRT